MIRTTYPLMALIRQSGAPAKARKARHSNVAGSRGITASQPLSQYNVISQTSKKIRKDNSRAVSPLAVSRVRSPVYCTPVTHTLLVTLLMHAICHKGEDTTSYAYTYNLWPNLRLGNDVTKLWYIGIRSLGSFLGFLLVNSCLFRSYLRKYMLEIWTTAI